MKSVILEEANGPNLKTESPDDEEDDGYRKRETIFLIIMLVNCSDPLCSLYFLQYISHFCSICWFGRLTSFANRDMPITEHNSTIYMPHSLPCLYFASDALKEGKQKTKMRRHPAILRLDWKMLLRSPKAILFLRAATLHWPHGATERGLEAA